MALVRHRAMVRRPSDLNLERLGTPRGYGLGRTAKVAPAMDLEVDLEVHVRGWPVLIGGSKRFSARTLVCAGRCPVVPALVLVYRFPNYEG